MDTQNKISLEARISRHTANYELTPDGYPSEKNM